jgi:NADH:ubiquinone oxidoreductase subunit 5 (subunit L)/multisubunit Na+/H+ antiporter MnhA subunit
MPIETPLFLLAIFLPLLCSPLFFWLPKGCKPYLGWIGSTIPFTSALLLYYSVFSQDEEIKHIVAIASYFSPLHLQLSFLADGLSLFFAFLVTLMGGLVFIYANDYMLKEEEEGSLSVFYAALSAFITFMLGALLSNDLLLQFTFWELTGACSFLLIGYHYHHSKAIQAAKGAFLLTSFADLGLLAGLILLGLSAGTFSWEEILIKNSEGFALPLKELTFLLLFMGIIGKSAQFPFHFWLPGAMCAPTPVSSYLHAATMVKLGVFLTARISPLFSSLELWFPLLTILCFSTMILGGIFSLLSHDLKAILAWATVSQLGFFIGFYGLENPHSVSKEFIHILNHALYKGALFMLVGIVSYSTKERDVRRLGGLFSLLPLTGVAFLIACASMAGIPGTTGFISKELIVSELL